MEQDKNITNPFGETPKSAYTPSAFLKTLRSYKGDVEEQLLAKKESVASIVIAEKAAQRVEEEAPKKKFQFQGVPKEIREKVSEKKGSIFSRIKIGMTPILIIALFVLGAGVLFAAYSFITKPQPILVATSSTSIIPYTSQKNIDVSTNIRAQLTSGFANLLQSQNSSIGSVTYLHFLNNNTELGINDFFQALAPQAPDALVRSFGGAYMSGIYSAVSNEPFIILSTTDYGQTFAGMLAWEPYIPTDLAAIFPELTSNTGNNTWNDDTFDNQDVRIIRDSSGTVILVYGFLDKTTLVITGTEDVFQQIASQYINNKLVR